MKKVIIFSSIVLILFGGIIFLTKFQQKEASKDNPYGKDDLHPETINQLNDPNYQNILLPDQLEKKLEDGEDVTVYFYSPTCPHCKETTPILMPLAEENNVTIQQFNLLEFEEGWNKYQIEYTPTLIHFEDGQEAKRIVGGQPKETYEEFLKQLGN